MLLRAKPRPDPMATKAALDAFPIPKHPPARPSLFAPSLRRQTPLQYYNANYPRLHAARETRRAARRASWERKDAAVKAVLQNPTLLPPVEYTLYKRQSMPPPQRRMSVPPLERPMNGGQRRMSFAPGVEDVIRPASFEIFEDDGGEPPSFVELPRERAGRKMPMTLRDPNIMKRSTSKKRVLRKKKREDRGSNVLRSGANALGNQIKKASANVVSSLAKLKSAAMEKKENVAPEEGSEGLPVMPILESPLYSMDASFSSAFMEEGSSGWFETGNWTERGNAVIKPQPHSYPHIRDVFHENPPADERTRANTGLVTIEEKTEISPCGMIPPIPTDKDPGGEMEDVLLHPASTPQENEAQRSHESDSSMDESHVSIPSSPAHEDNASSPLLKPTDLSPPPHNTAPTLAKMAQYIQSVMGSKSQTASLHSSSSDSSSNEDTTAADEGYERMESTPKRGLRQLSDASQRLFHVSNQSFHSAQGYGDDPVKPPSPTSPNYTGAQVTLPKVDAQGVLRGLEEDEEEVIVARRAYSGESLYRPAFARTASFHEVRLVSGSTDIGSSDTVRGIPVPPSIPNRKPTPYPQSRIPVVTSPRPGRKWMPFPRHAGYPPSTSSTPSPPIPEVPSPSDYETLRHISNAPSIVGSKRSSAGWESTEVLEEKDLPESMLVETAKSVKERVRELDMAIDQGLKFDSNDRDTGRRGVKEGYFSRWKGSDSLIV